jgi:fatty acid-binding protein DegV
VFVVDGLALAAGERVDRRHAVLTMVDGRAQVIDRVDTPQQAVEVMADYAVEWGKELNVAVGNAHRDGRPIADALARSIAGTANVREVIRFRVGASVDVGTGSGPGVVGCVMFPA